VFVLLTIINPEQTASNVITDIFYQEIACVPNARVQIEVLTFLLVPVMLDSLIMEVFVKLAIIPNVVHVLAWLHARLHVIQGVLPVVPPVLVFPVLQDNIYRLEAVQPVSTLVPPAQLLQLVYHVRSPRIEFLPLLVTALVIMVILKTVQVLDVWNVTILVLNA